MTIEILMHAKAMKRHTQSIEPATADIAARLPGTGLPGGPGLYLRLYPAGGLQLVVIPIDQLDELETAIKTLRAASVQLARNA